MTAGDLKGIVVVPFYFSQYKRRPDRKGPIFVAADGSSPNTASFVQNYVEGAWQNWQIQERISNGRQPPPQVNVQSRFWYNEELNSRHFLIPGSIAIIMTLIGTLLTALVISREWERGTMEALMATPVTMGEFIIAKMFSYFCMGIFSLSFCTFLATEMYGLPFRGSLTALFFVSSIFLLAALAMGLLISSIARNQFVASQISIISAFLPAFMLSGFIFEIASMPVLIRLLTYIFPAKYMVNSLQTLFLVGDVWELLKINIAAMAIIAAILFTIMALKTVKRLD
jgi:ABC-2 type transport system permease protein